MNQVQFHKYVPPECFGNSNGDFHIIIFFKKRLKAIGSLKITRQN